MRLEISRTRLRNSTRTQKYVASRTEKREVEENRRAEDHRSTSFDWTEPFRARSRPSTSRWGPQPEVPQLLPVRKSARTTRELRIIRDFRFILSVPDPAQCQPVSHELDGSNHGSPIVRGTFHLPPRIPGEPRAPTPRVLPKRRPWFIGISDENQVGRNEPSAMRCRTDPAARSIQYGDDPRVPPKWRSAHGSGPRPSGSAHTTPLAPWLSQRVGALQSPGIQRP